MHGIANVLVFLPSNRVMVLPAPIVEHLPSDVGLRDNFVETTLTFPIRPTVYTFVSPRLIKLFTEYIFI